VNQCAVSHQPKRVVTTAAQRMMPSAASEIAASRHPCELGIERHGSNNGSRNHCDPRVRGACGRCRQLGSHSTQCAGRGGIRPPIRPPPGGGRRGARQSTPRALPRVSGLSTAPTTRPSTICPAPPPAPTTAAQLAKLAPGGAVLQFMVTARGRTFPSTPRPRMRPSSLSLPLGRTGRPGARRRAPRLPNMAGGDGKADEDFGLPGSVERRIYRSTPPTSMASHLPSRSMVIVSGAVVAILSRKLE